MTNGQINQEAWQQLLPYVDAVNIDLKGFTPAFYDWLGGSLETTKAAICMAAEQGVHVEVTTLVIPGKNDSKEEMAAEARCCLSFLGNCRCIFRGISRAIISICR